MRPRRFDERGFLRSGLARVAGILIAAGTGLFLYVWWPIQAQRYLVKIKHLETEISQKKSELNQLQSKYNALTSLSSLDQWAKDHGPWKTPQANDILSFPSTTPGR